jgi:hypothetical protein
LLVATRALVLLALLFGANHAVELARGGHVISHVKAFAANLLALLFGAALLVVARFGRQAASVPQQGASATVTR